MNDYLLKGKENIKKIVIYSILCMKNFNTQTNNYKFLLVTMHISHYFL